MAGAAAGCVIGAALGVAVDDYERRRELLAEMGEAAEKAAVRVPKLSDIVQMTRDGVPANDILAQIQSSCENYDATEDDIKYLAVNNVDPAVITEVQLRRSN